MEYQPGSKEDFDRLYQASYQRIFRTLATILGDAAAAEDCTQDAFLKAYRAWPRWKGDSPAEAWVHRIAINTALSFIRKRRLREVGELILRLGRPVAPDPEERATGGQVLAEIRRLPAKQAAVVVLRHLHGYTNREIAAALGEPESTIATRLMVAKRTLRARLRDVVHEESDTSGDLSVLSLMNVNGGDGLNLERLLEQELQKAAGKLQGPHPLAGQSAYHAAFAAGGVALSPFSSILALVTTKAAVAAAAATIVVGGAAVGTVATGSPNPTAWGQAVVAAVQGCKATEAANDATASGARTSGSQASAARQNVGQCVRAFAKQHGTDERALHSKASEARENHPTGKPTDHPGGKPSDLPGHKPTDLPEGKPSDLPNGKPSDQPGGPPSGVPSVKPSPKATN